MIELDGSHLEGGGSLVRVALALSALTGKEFKVTSIRAGRPQPGLKAQHLHAIKALKRICNAETNEIELGSTELWFKPGTVKAGSCHIDIGTAGSITLLLQAVILPCLFASKKVTLQITGGTSGKWQASADYLQNLLLPHLSRFVEKIELKILKRGYYPKGGGEVKLEIKPRFFRQDFADFSGFWHDLQSRCAKIRLLEQGTLEQVRGIINVAAQLQEKNVAERIRKAALDHVRELKVPAAISIEYAPGASIGGEAILWAVFSSRGKVDYDNPVLLGSDVLIEPQKRSEEIGKEAAEKLKEETASRAAVDHHLADQLIQFMALLPGSEIKASKISNHTKTNMYVAEQFLPVKFVVEGEEVRVEGKE